MIGLATHEKFQLPFNCQPSVDVKEGTETENGRLSYTCWTFVLTLQFRASIGCRQLLVRFSSIPRPIGQSRDITDVSAEMLFPSFSAGVHCQQCWSRQGSAVFDTAQPGFSPANHGVARPPSCPVGWFGKAVGARDMPRLCQFSCRDT